MALLPVDKGIPVPKPVAGQTKYPVADLEVGDSFYVPDLNLAGSVRLVANRYKRKHPGWDYATRTDKEGIRVWRIA